MEPLEQSSGDEEDTGMSEQWEEPHVAGAENAPGLNDGSGRSPVRLERRMHRGLMMGRRD